MDAVSVVGAFGLSGTAGRKQAVWMKNLQKRVGKSYRFLHHTQQTNTVKV
jgi:hypothetical protein